MTAVSLSLSRSSRVASSVCCRSVVTVATTSSTAVPTITTQPTIRWIYHDNNKSPLLWYNSPHHHHHHHCTSFSPTKRTMVMVTQTKVSDLPPSLSQQQQQQQVDVNKKGQQQQQFVQFSPKHSHVLTVTSSCIQRIEKLVDQKKKAGYNGDLYYLRVFVDAGGCSGFTYKFELDSTELNDDDDIVVHYAIHPIKDNDNDEENDMDGQRTTTTTTTTRMIPRLVVDETSLGFIRGSKIDYVQEMIKSSFEISDNPQSESACGCGSSFAVKNFAANPALD